MDAIYRPPPPHNLRPIPHPSHLIIQTYQPNGHTQSIHPSAAVTERTLRASPPHRPPHRLSHPSSQVPVSPVSPVSKSRLSRSASRAVSNVGDTAVLGKVPKIHASLRVWYLVRHSGADADTPEPTVSCKPKPETRDVHEADRNQRPGLVHVCSCCVLYGCSVERKKKPGITRFSKTSRSRCSPP